MSRSVAVVVIVLLAGCVDPPPRDPPPPDVVVLLPASGSMRPARAPVPCEPCATVAAEAPGEVADIKAPDYERGAGACRLAVAHSVERAERRMVTGRGLLPGWPLEVWRTKSGRDPKVRARLDAVDVTPTACVAVCDWLELRGWKSGAVPCELR